MNRNFFLRKKHIITIIICCSLIVINGMAYNYDSIKNGSYFADTFRQLVEVVSEFSSTVEHQNPTIQNPAIQNSLDGNTLEEFVLDVNINNVTPRTGEQFYSRINYSLPPCVINITTTYSENCQEPTANNFTADWKIGIEIEDAPDNAISYQRNSQTIQTHTLTGTTDTLTIGDIPADGGIYDTLKVWFTNDMTCIDTLIVKRPSPCPSNVPGITKPAEVCTSLSSTDIGGTAFEDWNYDGVMNQSDTIGIQGVQVNLIDDCNNVTDITYTDSNGNYEFTSLTSGTTYRVEFVLPPSISCWAKPTQSGADNGTTIQFVEPGNCASLGLAASNEYCEDNPTLSTACYINGDMSRNGGAFEPGFYDVLVSYAYDEAGKNGDAGYTSPNHLAVGGEIGVVWGLAYDKNLDDLYSASFLKRHTGFPTKDSLGVIWKTDDPIGTPVNSPFIDLIALGEDIGQALVPNNRTLGQFTGDQSQDSIVFHLIGKVGLGDLEISDDYQTLYVVNLYQKEILAISINSGTISNRYTIPDMNCNNGETRPFALKYHRGKLYAGAVCTAENGGTSNDLQASVFELNGTNFIEIANVGLAYDRDWASAGANADWQPWINSWIWGSSPVAYPQPLLSDIEFDIDGSLILGFLDRTGHQVGTNNFHIDGAGNWSVTSGGEILRLCNINGTFITEGTGACAYNVSPLPIRGTGGEYYHGEDFPGGSHYETALGGLAMINGKGEVVTTGYSPLDFNTGGIYWLDNQTGASNKRYELYDNSAPGNFGKAAGFGDLEIMCTANAPIEIGNYVWYDQDNDGIQDACEPGIPGVQIFLRSTTGSTLDTYVSDVNGQYYFGESASGYTLEPNTTYYLVFGLFGGFDRATQFLFDSLKLSQANVISGTMPDEIDSDATITSTGFPTAIRDYPHIEVMTGDAGCIDHSFDVGFYQPCVIETSILAMTECAVNGGNAEVDVTFIVDWTASGNIEVKMNGVGQTIDIQNGAVSPDTFMYTIPADLAQNTFLAYNVDDLTCGDTTNFLAPPACDPCVAGTNIIGGNVFSDYNLNGINDDGGNTQAGIKVYIYGCDAGGSSIVIDSAYTNFYGDYSFDTGITDGTPYRVEFAIPDSLDFLQEGFNGVNSNTSVQFVTAPNCAVDLGVAAPSNYCQTAPQIITTCFVTQAYNGSYPDSAALVTFPLDATGDSGDIGYIYPTILATHGEIGSTYGLAYAQEQKSYFVSAFLKRASGFGPNGPGAIYKIDDAGTVSLHTDLNTLFPGSAGADPHDFSGDPSDLDYDDVSSASVGKVSLGDMEISVDGQTLYVVNLNDKKLYTIPINQTPTTGNVTSVDLPIPGDCPASSYNPFGLGIGPGGRIYVGAVCSSSSTAAGIEAYVYRFDGVSTFTNILQYDLDFIREVREWSNWTNSPSSSTDPAPMFTDIEFNGNEMLMGFRDRRGDQFYATSPSVLGDVYRACWNGQNWTLEDNAFCGTTVGEGVNEGNGPGGGRYYDLSDGVAVDAGGMGGLLMIPGGNLISTIMDPYRAVSAGVVHFNNQGEQTNLYEVYQIPGALPLPLFGKANGLGDLQARCEAAPIEIGNYIWEDTNGDGIQDPCEPALAGFNVTLYDMNGDSLTTVQTDSKGEYYFNSGTVGLDTLLPNTMYFIVIGEGGQFNTTYGTLTLSGNEYNLTIDSTGQGGLPRQNDSDGTLASGVDADFDGQPYLKITTGNSGSIDHTFDFGFTASQNYDYGDLPDIADGTTGVTDYETYDSTGGPSHLIIEGLFLGDTVDVDTDGYPDADALGDDTDNVDDEDGVIIFNSLDISPGSTIKLPLSVTNTTGDTAYLEAWIDWNGDGDFDLINELVADYKDNKDGVFPISIEFTVPSNALTGSLVGFRIRLSNTNNMTPYGRIGSGEIEDYLLGIDCPQVICLPIEYELKKE